MNNIIQYTPTITISETNASGSGCKPSRKRKPFTNQKGGQRQRSINEFVLNMQKITGSEDPKESAALLNAFLRTRKGKEVKYQVKNQFVNPQLNKILKNIKTLRNNTPQKERNSVLSTVSHIFSRSFLNVEHKFGISPDQYTRSRKREQGYYTKPHTGGRNKTPLETIETIQEYFRNDLVSRESANRTVLVGETGKREPIAVRYLLDSIRNTYQAFKENVMDIPESTFRKYMPKEIKDARRDTDACVICHRGKELEQKLNTIEKRFSKTGDESLLKEIDTMKEEISLIEDHRALEKKIRTIYNHQKASLKNGEALVVMDFKENMKLGRGCVETSRAFYDTPQRSVFTIALYSKKEGKTKLIYFTFVSKCLKHDTEFAFDCLKIVMNHRSWRRRVKTGVHFWVDNAPQHFRTYEFIHEFCQFASKGIPSTLNYFVEYHGKCICDSHFSLLSRYYEDYSSRAGYSKEVIYTTDELLKLFRDAVNATNKSIEDKNKRKRANTPKKPRLNAYFYEYKREENTTTTLNQVKVPGFTAYYHFELIYKVNEDRTASKYLFGYLHKGAKNIYKEYPIKTLSKERNKVSKQGWETSQIKPFSTRSLVNKEKARKKELEKKKKKKKRNSKEDINKTSETQSESDKSSVTESEKQQQKTMKKRNTPSWIVDDHEEENDADYSDSDTEQPDINVLNGLQPGPTTFREGVVGPNDLTSPTTPPC